VATVVPKLAASTVMSWRDPPVDARLDARLLGQPVVVGGAVGGGGVVGNRGGGWLVVDTGAGFVGTGVVGADVVVVTAVDVGAAVLAGAVVVWAASCDVGGEPTWRA
jgi:hypothetical protein